MIAGDHLDLNTRTLAGTHCLNGARAGWVDHPGQTSKHQPVRQPNMIKPFTGSYFDTRKSQNAQARLRHTLQSGVGFCRGKWNLVALGVYHPLAGYQ
jgi:hypothetical protein